MICRLVTTQEVQIIKNQNDAMVHHVSGQMFIDSGSHHEGCNISLLVAWNSEQMKNKSTKGRSVSIAGYLSESRLVPSHESHRYLNFEFVPTLRTSTVFRKVRHSLLGRVIVVVKKSERHKSILLR